MVRTTGLDARVLNCSFALRLIVAAPAHGCCVGGREKPQHSSIVVPVAVIVTALSKPSFEKTFLALEINVEDLVSLTSSGCIRE